MLTKDEKLYIIECMCRDADKVCTDQKVQRIWMGIASRLLLSTTKTSSMTQEDPPEKIAAQTTQAARKRGIEADE